MQRILVSSALDWYFITNIITAMLFGNNSLLLTHAETTKTAPQDAQRSSVPAVFDPSSEDTSQEKNMIMTPMTNATSSCRPADRRLR